MTNSKVTEIDIGYGDTENCHCIRPENVEFVNEFILYLQEHNILNIVEEER